jgi:hypothetical protein
MVAGVRHVGFGSGRVQTLAQSSAVVPRQCAQIERRY